MTRPQTPVTTGPRIVMQYWKGEVRVCELENAGSTLDVHISRGERLDEWIVEVRNGRADSAISLAERGATRASALLAAAGSWAAQGPALGLHTWNWDAVAQALKDVHAID